jgi:hypothetical protein
MLFEIVDQDNNGDNLCFQMTARQRRVHNEQVPPPPPPAPTVQELMAQQNGILRQLLQRQTHPQQHGGGQQQRPLAAATYQEFLSMQPPLFTKAEDPLDADVWLHVIESKFPLLTGDYPNETKARFAAQQLRGPARTWWDHFRAILPADRELSWEEFKTVFRGHHIPAGILDRKLNELQTLTQGTRTYCSTLRPSTTCASMQVIMLILMRRRETTSAGVSTPSCENVSTMSVLIASMSWSTWPSPRRIVL